MGWGGAGNGMPSMQHKAWVVWIHGLFGEEQAGSRSAVRCGLRMSSEQEEGKRNWAVQKASFWKRQDWSRDLKRGSGWKKKANIRKEWSPEVVSLWITFPSGWNGSRVRKGCFVSKLVL